MSDARRARCCAASAMVKLGKMRQQSATVPGQVDRAASGERRQQRRREYARLWRVRNIRHRREYRKRNAQRIREWHRVWYAANRDRILADRARSRRKNRKPRRLLTPEQRRDKRREERRRRVTEHARKGLCPRCTRPLATGKSRCRYHLQEAADWQRKHRGRKAAGEVATPLTSDPECHRRRRSGTRQLRSESARRRVRRS